ncbi:MAG: protein kinase [Pseudomonadota bacterium]|nr:protein kinase [Pseudomonadota bacterium]
MLEAGRQVGNYRVEQLIGRGGQGLVYRAVHVQLGSVHVLKVLQLDRGPLRERLLDEGRIQARLRHPNLVPVTDVVEVDGALALVAEFVAGVPMDAWVAAEHPSLDTRLDVFRGVCAAVGFAHGARVVHRDLKPTNVLVEVVEGRAIPRVTDFGVAKLLDPIPGQSVTLPGLPVGTPGYMAPEQLRDASSVDERADVFALGCLLYELACGMRPFPDRDLATYAAALTTGAFVAPDDCTDGLPPEVGRTVAACLRIDPGARPADIAGVVALLDGALHVPPPTHPAALPAASPAAPPSGPPRRTPTRVDEGPPPPSDTFVPLGTFGSGASVASLAPIPPVSILPMFRPRRRTLRWLILIGAIVATAASTAAASAWLLGWPRAESEPLAAVAVSPPSPVAPALQPDGAVVPPPTSPPPEGAPKAGPVAPLPQPTGVRAAPASGPSSAGMATEPPISTAEPRAPRPGKAVSSGDGTVVWLTAGDRRHSPDEVPAGQYTILARFPGVDELITAGSVAIQAGRTTRIVCGSAQQMCRAEEGP